ncbi:hypothetical protein PUR71_02065 [Streptomyces sp. SP17BM10]|uniref:hypothetical protein n=1 Tax=Streptomyces sp. SP17BM10 TaxID=3002530 RepID=UPI002E77EB7C|nr:hypothetical protein [Streptomyces sp. SP17BM10]MEE1781724.1 hypothetical protein [Streptomyces sp. SP17BM10]
MRRTTGTGRAGAAALVALGILTAAGCGGGGGGGALPGAAPVPAGVDFATVLNDKAKIQAALPDPGSMHGWAYKSGNTDVAPTPPGADDCAGDGSWDCAALATGRIRFEAEGERATFVLRAFADRPGAQDACRKESAWSAGYPKADVPPVAGTAGGHAYRRNAGGLDGINLTMCLGTVVATTTLERGALDPAELHRLSELFAARIQKAAAP